jgi:ribosome biogenesis GTPase
MSPDALSLARLGWRTFHAQQLRLEDLDTAFPARVSGVHRSALAVISARGAAVVSIPPRIAAAQAVGITVGDWVLVENDAPRVARVLEPYSLLLRTAAGTDHRQQAIAANLDALFVVTSCNEDFNPSRLERYLALAFEARVTPVIVLTKTDLCGQVEHYARQAALLSQGIAVLAVNATQPACAATLEPWLQPGQTVAFVGSSGVGKSTLVNSLTGATQATAGIREDDSKGRHTTTAREMFALDSGAWLIDTPGMRELKVGAMQAGLESVFGNIEALAAHCRFRDCRHECEAGCAVLAAIASGQLDARRLANYHKLQREAAHAAMTAHERHARERKFGRVVASAIRLKRQRD